VGCRGHRVQRPHPEEDQDEADLFRGVLEHELYGACLEHLGEADRDVYLASLRPGSDVDHRGTTFDGPLLDLLLEAVLDPTELQPHFGAVRFERARFERPQFNEVRFSGDAWFNEATFDTAALFFEARFEAAAGFNEATFEGGAGCNGARFSGDAWFNGARFRGDAWFNEATFGRDTGFNGATFGRDTGFNGARFKAAAWLNEATFEGAAWFFEARFEAAAWLNEATFEGNAGFNEARFEGAAWFNEVRFRGSAEFGKATFGRDAEFSGAKFESSATFCEARFEGASQLGPLACRGTVNLMAAVFSIAVTLEIAASRVDCRRTVWVSTASLRLRHAVLVLSDAVLEFPVTVSAHPPFAVPQVRPVLDESGLVEAPVRVASLRGVDASHLVLTDVDLSNCRFAGTIHLEQLRLHGRCILANAPAGLQRRGLVPVRWTSRQTLAEEHHWRATRGQAGAGWVPDPIGTAPFEPAALAPVYRELRKGFEDAKNEPGAADFYYGEMEMRRHNRSTPWPERMLLWLYWAASGYGLRASRALGWLLGAMTVTVLLMVGFGLPDTPAKPYPSSAGVIGKQNPQLHAEFPDRFTTARTHKAADVVINSVVFRSSGQHLTTAGRYTEMASRLIEPILLALALLAVRGRVKR
jgi:uncharacterized protein YjbI with pentapeptide repeats